MSSRAIFDCAALLVEGKADLTSIRRLRCQDLAIQLAFAFSALGRSLLLMRRWWVWDPIGLDSKPLCFTFALVVFKRRRQ